MKAKKVLALIISAAMVFSLAACGSGNSSAGTGAGNTQPKTETTTETKTETKKETAAADKAAGELAYTAIDLDALADTKATIKFIHNKTDRDADGTIDRMIGEFNAEFPNITVDTEAITDYAEDALLRLSTDNWGDIMFIPAVNKADLSTYFMPLDTTANLSQVLNFADQWQNGDYTYGIPYLAGAQGVLYNKRVFSEAGITKMPATPTEFIEALETIKANTDAIPLYTNYATGWTMGAWDAYLGCVSNGDNTYINQKLVHTAEPFADPGDDTGAYNIYRVLYDACAKGLIEDDYTATDWESSKGMMNRGEIATMVLSSWAYAQMQEAGDTPEDIGYMPFPMTIAGTQYVSARGDYSYAINAKSSDENKLASLIFIKWMTEESNWCFNEGGYTIVKGGTNPDMYKAFDGYNVLTDQPAIAGEEDFLNRMNAESGLSINANGNDKVQRIVEAGVTGSESFADIMADWNAKWQAAQKKLGIEVKY